MNKLIYILILWALFSACLRTESHSSNNTPKNEESKADTVVISVDSRNLSELFTLNDAEKILGQKAHLIDSSTTDQKDAIRYQNSYKGNFVDSISKKTGAVYFLLEHYKQLSAAKERYSYIKKANEKSGIKVLNDLGDEAYFHTDDENFYFIMVRKDARVFNMKVNKITSLTSLDDFNKVARQIVNDL